MEGPGALWFLGQTACLFTIILSHDTTSVYDRPYHTAATVLSITGTVLLILTRYTPVVFSTTPTKHEATALPLNDAPKPHSSRTRQSTDGTRRTNLGYFIQILWPVLLSGFICMRIELLRQVVNNAQCAGPNYSILVPLVVFMFETLGKPRHNRKNISPDTRKSFGSPLYRITQGPWGFIVPAACLTYWSFTSLKATAVRSTYICAGTLSFRSLIPVLQILGTCLDVSLYILTKTVAFKGQERTELDIIKATRSLAVVMLGSSAVIVLIIGPITYWVRPESRYWMLRVDPLFRRCILKFSLGAVGTIISALQLAFRFGANTSLPLLLLSWTYSSAAILPWVYQQSFPPIAPAATSLIALSLTGTLLTVWSRAKDHSIVTTSTMKRNINRNRLILGFSSIMLVSTGASWRFGKGIGSPHPIQSLMTNAGLNHRAWAKQAISSRSLTESATTYRKRYGRDPPPQFDKWFNYASLHDSHIIDDFDNIYEDLLPFWSLTPAEIRLRTWEAFANPWNGIGGMIIRDGRAEVAPNVPGTHRWMIDGVVHMVEKFAKWLPDMDLAFNMNDESRVAIGFEELMAMKQTNVPPSTSQKPNEFSKERYQGWKGLPQDPFQGTRFQERSWHRTWDEFGIAGCPPKSRAKLERHWDLSTQCAACLKLHTEDSFVSNWTLSADPCHQTDVGDLHGLHLSPAAYKASKELMPIFSQSKAHGYNDILYPSAWNYEDKAIYAPTTENPDYHFLAKEPTFFWRGATSEGVSPGTGVWRGMMRQRLVHLFNNATNHEKQFVLLPRQWESEIYTFRHLPPSSLRSQISSSVGFVRTIERCDGRDCSDQCAEFQPQSYEPIDFQQHWRYRYLFDLDGAGFSGRFLPFLRSRSLVLKAGLMREWWEGRVFAWKHFVPLDVRLGEVWSVAAYFAGWKEGRHHLGEGGQDKGGWLMKPHDEEGEAIALAGREWAEQVLRKEDMEIYMFRLLLEFGRLTDDARERIGYTEDLTG